MKNIATSTHLFFPDIVHYMNGRDTVINILLECCKNQKKERKCPTSATSRLFSELSFDMADLIAIVLNTEQELFIRFSYKVILQIDEHSTIEDLGTEMWKYMSKTIKNN